MLICPASTNPTGTEVTTHINEMTQAASSAPVQCDFDEIIVVFDPLDKRQLPLIRKHLPRIQSDIGNFPVTWIATQLDREKGWDSHVQISDELDEHVYLLPTDVRDRFELEHVPTILFARDKKFEIVEIGLEEDVQ